MEVWFFFICSCFKFLKNKTSRRFLGVCVCFFSQGTMFINVGNHSAKYRSLVSAMKQQQKLCTSNLI